MTSKKLPKTQHNTTLSNGRSAHGTSNPQKWFAQIPILDLLVLPAWRSLSKTATDMAIIIRAKHSRAAAFNEKKDGRPVFNFTVSEAVRVLKISRPTCTRAFKELNQKGFIEILDSGGILFGKGRPAIFTWSGRWRSWEAPPRNNANMLKARAMRNKPGKCNQLIYDLSDAG